MSWGNLLLRESLHNANQASTRKFALCKLVSGQSESPTPFHLPLTTIPARRTTHPRSRPLARAAIWSVGLEWHRRVRASAGLNSALAPRSHQRKRARPAQCRQEPVSRLIGRGMGPEGPAGSANLLEAPTIRFRLVGPSLSLCAAPVPQPSRHSPRAFSTRPHPMAEETVPTGRSGGPGQRHERSLVSSLFGY